MNLIFMLLALFSQGLTVGLQESDFQCGGDVLVVIEDVHFRQIDLEPDVSVCVENKDDVPALVIDSGDDGCLEFIVPANGWLFLEEEPNFLHRMVTIDVVAE